MPDHATLLVTLLSLGSSVTSTHVSYRGGQQGPAARFVHFTKLVSRTANVDFSPLYGSLRITEPGLYSLSYSLQAGQGPGLETGLYLYPATARGRSASGSLRHQMSGCEARPGCGCSSTSLVTLHPGDVVRLEVDSGTIAASEFNTFIMYQVENNGVKVPQKRSDCSEKCYCNCNNDCCSPEQDFFSPTTARPPAAPPMYYNEPSSARPPAAPPIHHNYPMPSYPGTSSTSRPVIYITTPPPRVQAPSPPPPVYHMTPPPAIVEARVTPPAPGYLVTTPPDLGCCPRVLVSLYPPCDRVQAAKAGLYTLMEDSLTWAGTNTSFPVYRQQQIDNGEVNFLYYFSVPGSWSGWLIGPRRGGSRGGLLSETGARCPGEAAHAQWSYYSPDRGFTRGDIRVTCAARGAGVEDNTSFHIHHHFHHQEVASVPSYNIKSDGEIIDARFVFPSSRTGPRGGNITLTRGDAVPAV